LTMVNRDPKKRPPEVPDPFPTPDTEAKKSKAHKPNSFAAVAAKLFEAQRRKQEHVS